MEVMTKIGKGFDQIVKTTTFEAHRNLKKFIIMIITNTIIFVLTHYMVNLEDNIIPKATDFASSYLSFVNMIILILAITFAASIIVEDFEKQTGNLLFPKTEKGRLLIGRYLVRYTYAALSLIIFYMEVAIITNIEYNEVPNKLWGSMGWALLYLHLMFAFVVFISSLLNRVATTSILSLIMILMVFPIVTVILMFAEITAEPLFILTYYENIITAWFNMPETRFIDISPMQQGMNGPGLDERTFRNWITPSSEGAIIGTLIYSGIMLILAFLIYRIKQSKN